MSERNEVFPNVSLVLSQRMSLLENTAACLSSSKASLRSNVEALRKDISDCFSHQLALIRAREQEVLRELQYEAEKRESAVSAQQQYVHKLIGACQMAMDSIRKGEGSSNFEGLLNSRMPQSDKGQLNGMLVFDRDSLKMRSVIGSFGSIKFQADNLRSPNTGNSLPLEMEEYDDHVGVTHHKSVMRFASTPTTPAGQTSELVERWLNKVPTDADVNALMAEFEEIKTTPNVREDSSDCTSFDIVSQTSSGTKKAAALSDEFVEILHRPLADWLLNAVPMPSTKPADNATHFELTKPEDRPMKRRHSYDTPVQPKKYGFQTVMQDIRDSSFKEWYNPRTTPEPAMQSTSNDVGSIAATAQDLPGLSEPKFNEAKFLDSLRKIFAGNKIGEEAAQRRTNLTMDSVLYWKNLLDTFQETQKWLGQ